MEVNYLINYVDENNNIIMKNLAHSFLIKDENDLNILTNANCSPGTQAYLIDKSKIWKLNADREWELVVNKNVSTTPSTSNSCMIVEYNSDTGQLNKTWQEIYDAMANSVAVFIRNYYDSSYISLIDYITVPDLSGINSYWLEIDWSIGFYANTANDYPSRPDEEDDGK